MKKKLVEVVKYLNSMFKDSILKFENTEDKLIKIVLKNEKYMDSYSIIFSEDFYNKLENVLHAIGILNLIFSREIENAFECLDDDNQLIWE